MSIAVIKKFAERSCRMTIEELKEEAKKHGLYLNKATAYTKLSQCICGCKRRHVISQYDKKSGTIRYAIECIKCKKQSPFMRTEEDARKAWNEMIEKEMNDVC